MNAIVKVTDKIIKKIESWKFSHFCHIFVQFKISIWRCRDCHTKHREMAFQSNSINSDENLNILLQHLKNVCTVISSIWTNKYLDVNNDFTMYTDISQSKNIVQLNNSHLTVERDFIISTVYSRPALQGLFHRLVRRAGHFVSL